MNGQFWEEIPHTKSCAISILLIFWKWPDVYCGQIFNRAERHDFWSRFLLFSFSSSLFFWEGREKGKWITKVVVKSHAFLLDPIVLPSTKTHKKRLNNRQFMNPKIKRTPYIGQRILRKRSMTAIIHTWPLLDNQGFFFF